MSTCIFNPTKLTHTYILEKTLSLVPFYASLSKRERCFLFCSWSSQSTARIAICYPHACFVQYIHEKSPVVSLTSQTIPFLVAFYPCRIIRARVFILSDLDADANNNSSSRSLSLSHIYNHFPVSCCSKHPRSARKMSNLNHRVYLPVNAKSDRSTLY